MHPSVHLSILLSSIHTTSNRMLREWSLNKVKGPFVQMSCFSSCFLIVPVIFRFFWTYIPLIQTFFTWIILICFFVPYQLPVIMSHIFMYQLNVPEIYNFPTNTKLEENIVYTILQILSHIFFWTCCGQTATRSDIKGNSFKKGTSWSLFKQTDWLFNPQTEA